MLPIVKISLNVKIRYRKSYMKDCLKLVLCAEVSKNEHGWMKLDEEGNHWGQKPVRKQGRIERHQPASAILVGRPCLDTRCPPKALLSLPSSTGQGRETTKKGSWVNIRTGRDHSSITSIGKPGFTPYFPSFLFSRITPPPWHRGTRKGDCSQYSTHCLCCSFLLRGRLLKLFLSLGFLQQETVFPKLLQHESFS